MNNSSIHNPKLLNKIKEISNSSKFKIIEMTQNRELSITILAKETKLAYNKCSNYCSSLESKNLVSKNKKGKEVFVKSILNLEELSKVLLI